MQAMLYRKETAQRISGLSHDTAGVDWCQRHEQLRARLLTPKNGPRRPKVASAPKCYSCPYLRVGAVASSVSGEISRRMNSS
jgi:hypothetical protein